MATRIFLAMGSLLIREIRRSGVWHFSQTVSTPKTRRSKSDHLMYLRLLLGLSWVASGHRTTASVAGGAPVRVVTPPPVAITVARYDPPATLAPTFTVSVLEPAPGALIDVADSVAVIPCGSPLTAKVSVRRCCLPGISCRLSKWSFQIRPNTPPRWRYFDGWPPGDASLTAMRSRSSS